MVNTIRVLSMTVQSFTIATMHLSEATFVVVDLETSGAAPSTGAAITEIGAVKVRGGVVIGEFETFVNPGVQISEFITQLTGSNAFQRSDNRSSISLIY
jgi:DNA polymerase III alpha subunit (gram-positive type)